jgi:LacI family transcriptional regulator
VVNRPRIKDVAERAGVSTATVSLVLNNVDGIRVASATRDRVRTAATELGYRPNSLARSLRTQHTQMIGFVSDEIATTPYAGKMIQGAQDVAWRAGYVLLLVNTGSAEELQRRAVQALLERQVDGIVFATMFHQVVELPEAISTTPAVVLDARPSGAAVPFVVPDETAGAETIMTELIDAGHRRIAHITDRVGSAAAQLRRRAYAEVLKRNGLPLDPDLVVGEDTDHEGGHRAAKLILDHRDPPTAVFCFNDQMAMGVYRAAAERGWTIPDDLSVVGFDDQELIAGALSPGLTTVALPHYAMGEWAVQTLLEHIEDPDADSSHVQPAPVGHLMPCPLVRRASVAAPPARRRP